MATATLLYFGGRQVLADSELLKAHRITPEQALTVGDLVMFLSYLVALLGPIATLAASATGLQTSLAALDRVLDLMQEPREMPSTSTAVTLTKSQVPGRIVFRDVSFAYPAASARSLLVPQITFVSPPKPKFHQILGDLPIFPSRSPGVSRWRLLRGAQCRSSGRV